MAINYYCVDAGTSYCPCHLAKIDSCLICSLLQGQKTCDCKWQGLCTYQEYVWNGKGIKEEKRAHEARIIEKAMVEEKVMILRVLLESRELLSQYDQPGAFAFIRRGGTPEYYDVPICVMDIDESTSSLTFAIHIVGPKTKVLAAEKEKVLLRGPYLNGIFGLKYIKASFNKNWLLIGGGIGQVSLVSVAKNLLRGDNNITALLELGHLKNNLVGTRLKDMGIAYQKIDSRLFDQRLVFLLKEGSIDYMYSAGSDVQHKLIGRLLERNGYNIPLVISNNHNLCCGEGICGSCQVHINGELIHLCKIQLDSKDILGGVNSW